MDIHNLINDLLHFQENVFEKVDTCLKRGDIKQRDYFGRTPLLVLLNCSHKLTNLERTIMSLLMKYGADLMERDIFGNTGYHYLAKRGEISFFNEKTIKVYNNKQQTPFFFAVFSGQIELVNFLLELGDNAYYKDINNQSVFDLQSEWENYDIMEDFFVNKNMMKRSWYSLLNKILRL